MVVGATLENFIYDTCNEEYVSAARFVGRGKGDIRINNTIPMYSNYSVMKLHIPEIRFSGNDFEDKFYTMIIKSLESEIKLIESYREKHFIVHNVADARFSFTEMEDNCIIVNGCHHYIQDRAANFELHFSEPFLQQEQFCDILDRNLKDFYEQEPNGWRKGHIAKFGRNMIKREYIYFGQMMRGIEYRSFSSHVVGKNMFPFIKQIKKCIDEYHN